jgi:hypothetical protein
MNESNTLDASGFNDNIESGLLSSTSLVSSTGNVILDQTERCRRFGIECLGPKGDGIAFLAGYWTPGGEYVQKLTVRNVSTTVKKIKYKLPSTRYFSLSYPEVIILSPGMFKDIDVVFRPVELSPYDDTIFFKMQEGPGSGGFHVPVRAFISKLIVTTPYGTDLGFCPTHQITSTTFQLTNTGEVEAPFRWEAPTPFVLNPMEGIVAIGQSMDIEVSIFPTDATVFVSQAICYVGEGVHAIIPEPILTTRLSAIGKYTYVILSEDIVDFGEVLSGSSAESTSREVLLRNNSVVPAEFNLIRHESDRDEVFSIYPKSGVIPALGSVTIFIEYYALAMGSYSLDRYTFKTPGNSTTILTCKGLTMHKRLSLSKENVDGSDVFFEGSPGNSINFRDTELGEVSSRIIILKNDSVKPISFYIKSDLDGTFSISPRQGIIPALLQYYPVKLVFKPVKPINYYRRFFILVGDSLPTFIDALGSGYIRAKGEIKEQRPWPLRHAHIQAYMNRTVFGLGRVSPDELDGMYENYLKYQNTHELFDEEKPAVLQKEMFALVGIDGTRALAVTALQNPVTRTGESTRTAVAPAHEFFIDDVDHTCKEITVDKSAVDFGYTTYNTSSDSHYVTITNHTGGKVAVVWACPPDNSSADSGDGTQDTVTTLSCVFDVEPGEADINAGKSQTFKVNFRPLQSNRNYVSELEAYVYFKNQRTFRLVNDATMTPPWCMSICASGHTFSTGQLLAKSKIMGSNIRSGKLSFPCCYYGESLFQTVMLRNMSNLPSTFKLELGWEGGETLGNQKKSTSLDQDAFSVKPLSGEIGADDFVLICIRFTPTGRKSFEQLLRCIVNGESSGRLLLEGAGSLPFVFCPDVGPLSHAPADTLGIKEQQPLTIPQGFLGSFYLKPTCIGLSSSRTIRLSNGSRIPIRFRITLPSESVGIMSISQSKGLLKGNEDISIIISFAPQNAMKYDFKMKIRTYPIGGKANRVIDARQAGNVQAPEVLQNLIINVIAPGEVGAIIFDPPRLAAGVRLVNTSECKDVYLENASDCELSYSLCYCTEFVPDSGSINKGKEISEFIPLIEKKDANDLKNTHSLLCDIPSGILPARSRTRIPFTFSPSNAGLYEFFVYAKVQSIGSDGLPSLISNEESALLRISKADREAEIFDFNISDENLSNTLAEKPLMATITGRASYPTLIIDDVRIEDNSDSLIASVDQLWRQFSVADINYDLSIPLTVEEQRINTTSTPDLTKLKRYDFKFTPAVIGSPLQVLYFQIRNNGFLPTNFHTHLPNEKELDLEAWCDEDDPSEELNQMICIIEELKCFTFEPRAATLEPGEICTIKCTYSHTFMKYGGFHKIPLLVKLDQGKQFYIDLSGRTLAINNGESKRQNSSATNISNNFVSLLPNKQGSPDILLLAHHDTDKIVKLQPVPIGLVSTDAPRQRTELVNVSSTEISYEVDTKSIDAIVDSNHNMPIILLVNPKGVIPPFSSLFLEWFFYPIEIKTYTFPLEITYNQVDDNGNMKLPPSRLTTGRNKVLGNILDLIIHAEGYDPKLDKPLQIGEDFNGGLPPLVQLIKLPGQLAQLSTDLLNFNVIPQTCNTHRMLIIQNLSKSSSIDFIIDDSSCFLFGEGILTASPSYGLIEPNSIVVVNFKIIGICAPMNFYDCIKVTVREVIKSDKNKRAGISSRSKLIDKIKSSKVSSFEHESIVNRSTSSRNTQMNETNVPLGRTAKAPSTVVADGSVVTSKENQRQEGNNIAWGDNSQTGGYNSSALINSFAGNSVNMINNNGMQSPSKEHDNRRSRSRSPGTSRSVKREIHSPESMGRRSSRASLPPVSATPTESRVSKSSDARSLQSRSKVNVLLGPPHTVIVRIKGEILPIEVTSKILGKGPQKDIINEFVVPQTADFIFPISSTALKVGSAKAPEGGNSVRSKVNIPIKLEREEEIRGLTEELVSDLFRNLLGSESLDSLIKETSDADSNVTTTTGLRYSNDLREAPTGSSHYGLFFQEISSEMSLFGLFCLELYHLGYESCSIVNNNTTRYGTGTSKKDNIVNGIPAQWTVGIDAKIADLNHFSLPLDQFLIVLSKINITPENTETCAIYETFETLISGIRKANKGKNLTSSEIDNLPVCVATLFTKLSSTSSDHLKVILGKSINKRRKSNLLQRKNEIEITTPTINEEIITTTTDGDNNITDNNTSEEIEVEVKTRLQKEVLSKELLNKQSKEALNQTGFLDIANDILRNTMFNLVQEACFGEFTIDTEPIIFATKK